MIEKQCLNCGKPFLTKDSPSRRSTGRGKYCSRSCAISATHAGLPKPKSRENVKIAREALIGKPAHNRKPPVTLICETCKQPFNVQPSLANKARFCSRKCANAWKRTRTGIDHPLFKRVEMACEMCGKMVFVKQCKADEFRFCSRRCQGAYTSSIWPRTSSIERALHEELTNRTIAFETEYRIGQFVIDIAFPDAMLAVEADGTYWHGNEKQQKKDRRKDGFLKRNGWRVLRLTEVAIKADVCSCVDRIESIISPTST